MTRVAAIDCGTNSLRLLVADVDAGTGRLCDVERRMEIVRLGQGVDATGRIDERAMARTLALTREYADVLRALEVTRVRFVATSATRDAANRGEFVRGVRSLVGVEPEVIPGDEEAALSFAGATRELAGVHEEPFLVVDIGGGSTEVVLGTRAGVSAACSVDVGCVRLTERHLAGGSLADGRIADGRIAAARTDVDEALDRVASVVPLAGARTLVGLAGSVTTVTAHALELSSYDPARIHGAAIGVEAAGAACDALLRMSHAQRAALPFMHPGRVDVIGAGALIWQRVIERVVGAAGITEVVASEHDILDGIAWSLA